MVGTYYLHQDTIDEIIKDPANQNVHSSLTANSTKQMSQGVTVSAKSYKDDPSNEKELPADNQPAFTVNNAIAAVCMSNNERRGPRRQIPGAIDRPD